MNDSSKIQVLIVDDHGVVRNGLIFMLQRAKDIQVVGAAENGRQAVHMCAQLSPDVVLMDLMMPEMNGIEAIEAIRKLNSQTRIIALTSFHEEDLVQNALRAGAISYLLKNVKAGDLTNSIREAYQGQSVLAPEATQALIHTITEPELVEELKPREVEVLTYLVEGLTNAQIAEEMIMSVNTVRHYVRNILGKLDAANRTEAAVIALQRKLIKKGNSDL